jgi:hypothetical protein
MATKDDETETNDKPAPLTREDVERMAAEIANRAAADHGKRLQAKYEKQLEEERSKRETLQAQLDELRTPKEEPEGKGKKEPKEDARAKEFEARMAAIEKERAAERTALADKERKAQEAEERSVALDALKDIGVTGAPAQAAHLLLKTEGKIARDEDGKLVFVVPKDGYTDRLSIADGVKEWAGTEAGKAFLPPKGVSGSGNKGGSNTRAGKGPASRAERVAEARQAILAAFGGGSRE